MSNASSTAVVTLCVAETHLLSILNTHQDWMCHSYALDLLQTEKIPLKFLIISIDNYPTNIKTFLNLNGFTHTILTVVKGGMPSVQ